MKPLVADISVVGAPTDTARRSSPPLPLKPADAWVRMSERMRYFILGLLCLYTAVCVIGAFSNASNNSACIYLAFSSLVYLGAVAFPLFAYKKEDYGWFHPLVLGSLWTIVKVLPRRMGLSIFGLREHAVLDLSPEELTGLVAYENVLNALGLLCVYAGFHVARHISTPKLVFRRPENLHVVIGVAAVISFAALGIFMAYSGSVTQHFINLSLNAGAKVYEKEVTGLGHITILAAWLSTALCIALAYQPGLLRKWFFAGLALASIALIYLATGKRSLVATPVLVGALCWMLSTRRIPLFRLFILGTVLLAGFGFLLVVRQAASMAKSMDDVKAVVSENQEQSFWSGLEEMSYRLGEYSSVYPILHYVPEQAPMLWGDSYLLVFGRPIPRVIWPEKPRGTDFRAGMMFFNSPWGVPPGTLGEAYWNFHIPGVIGVFFLFGVFLRWLANLYLRYRDHGCIIFFYAFTMMVFAPAENAITLWMQGLIPVLLFVVATGIYRPGRMQN